MASLFVSEQEKKEILSLYDEKLRELNIDYEYRSIATEYGNTNVIVCGNPAKPPIILVHGANGCAPIAIEAYIGLIDTFSIYAIDVLAQPNKSAETRISMKDDSYGIWMNKIIDSLKIENVIMAGFSFGGLVILKTLEFNESRIKEVYLSSPAYIVNGNPIKALFKVFIPMKRYMKTKNQKYIEKFLAEIFTERDKFAVKYLSKVFLYFKMDFSSVPIIEKEKAKGIKTPITLFAAKKDILFPGNKMIRRALKIFPSLKNYKLLENSKHVQNRVQNRMIEHYITKK
ncbi:alpha/beta hydrolase [Aquimarina atlantica]|uniref:Alpha/beta hydrolase n=1 Tax=Aquimarina atlantica TaxID=1317122 RepID=A0A023BTU4_9FLAO|nr:alpha/beta fold hydrolase [Aquimarina atlantica]EZH73364.1 alpha/beta hydrolase [Aquimarina atlantica]